jgi:hypothetical protein
MQRPQMRRLEAAAPRQQQQRYQVQVQLQGELLQEEN